MTMSSFFHALRSAYQAEIDDLTFDSDGKNVLNKRLADKRKALAFLSQMIEISPEMVAVVFHQGFQFKQPSAMEDLVGQESDNLPDWDSLSNAVVLQPWAQALSQEMLKEPMGGWLMAVAAGLEYLYSKPSHRPTEAEDGDGDDDTENGEAEHGDAADEPDDNESESSARRRQKAGEDWMENQGFDRKDR